RGAAPRTPGWVLAASRLTSPPGPAPIRRLEALHQSLGPARHRAQPGLHPSSLRRTRRRCTALTRPADHGHAADPDLPGRPGLAGPAAHLAQRSAAAGRELAGLRRLPRLPGLRVVAQRLPRQPGRAALGRAGAAALPASSLVLGHRRPVALRQPPVAVAPDLSRRADIIPGAGRMNFVAWLRTWLSRSRSS